MPGREIWDLLDRNSTSEESASEFSLSVHDLFMSANKAIRWGNLPSGSFMCVWKSFGLIPSQTFSSWAAAPACQINIDRHLCHQMRGIKVSSLCCSPRFQHNLCVWICTNTSVESRVGTALNRRQTRNRTSTPGVLGWYCGSGLYISYLDLNKMTHVRDWDWLSPESFHRFCSPNIIFWTAHTGKNDSCRDCKA